MKKIINSIPYSTDSSCRLGYFQHRTILDPTYCREELYITRQGTYFLYVEGRESSLNITGTFTPLVRIEETIVPD